MASAKKAFLFFIVLFIATLLTAEELSSPTYGYCLDLPEGCTLSDKDANGTSYQFSNTVLPVNTALKVYRKAQFSSSLDALNATLKKLNATAEAKKVEWRNEEGATATFKMKILGVEMTGLGAAAILPNDKGIIVIFTWCPAAYEKQCTPFMESTVDCLSIDRGSLYEAGIITTQNYPVTSKKIPVTLTIDGKTISTLLDSNDSAASEALVEREYSLLTQYAEQGNLIKDALLRYYRMQTNW